MDLPYDPIKIQDERYLENNQNAQVTTRKIHYGAKLARVCVKLAKSRVV